MFTSLNNQTQEVALYNFRLAILNRQSDKLPALLSLLTPDNLLQVGNCHNRGDDQAPRISRSWDNFTALRLLVLFESPSILKAALSHAANARSYACGRTSALTSSAFSRCVCWNYRAQTQSHADTSDIDVIMILLIHGSPLYRHHLHEPNEPHLYGYGRGALNTIHARAPVPLLYKHVHYGRLLTRILYRLEALLVDWFYFYNLFLCRGVYGIPKDVRDEDMSPQHAPDVARDKRANLSCLKSHPGQIQLIAEYLVSDARASFAKRLFATRQVLQASRRRSLHHVLRSASWCAPYVSENTATELAGSIFTATPSRYDQRPLLLASGDHYTVISVSKSTRNSTI